MSLQFQTRSRFLELHLSNSLNDWDMDEEIKLTTTTDQFYQAGDKRNDQYLVQWQCARISRRKDDLSFQNYQKSVEDSPIQPNLWLMVNPNLACPIKYPQKVTKILSPKVPLKHLAPVPKPTVTHVKPKSIPNVLPVSPTEDTCLADSRHDASSSEYMLTDEDDASSVDVPVCRKVKTARKAKAPNGGPRKLSLAQSKRLQRVLQDSNNLKSGAWLRPPVNYCILIAMAIGSSRTGSLNVQQIYNFTREHFPFFQTAPDGWKNTIRHNLCFSNSFRKTPQQVCSEGKRKSCLWHLTLEGRRRLRDEIHTLTGDSYKVLKRSMNNPDMIQTLFAL
ncbi:forkhead box protein R1 isoform X1 [Oncorhynchus nerka]|uniref:forkhead box protein R1 isoform X1 n=1 Tax=Oncorhynchus nerka TaxID=8023 RepID=UPI0011307082|nr:forkhead box protein N5-like isoform X1 [Oncorhynchus nerka]